MRLRRNFSKRANAAGRLVYRRQANFPVRINVKRASLTLENGDARRNLAFAVLLDGERRIEVSGPADQPFISEVGLRIPRGKRDLVVLTEGFEANQLVEGTLEIEYSLF